MESKPRPPVAGMSNFLTTMDNIISAAVKGQKSNSALKSQAPANDTPDKGKRQSQVTCEDSKQRVAHKPSPGVTVDSGPKSRIAAANAQPASLRKSTNVTATTPATKIPQTKPSHLVNKKEERTVSAAHKTKQLILEPGVSLFEQELSSIDMSEKVKSRKLSQEKNDPVSEAQDSEIVTNDTNEGKKAVEIKVKSNSEGQTREKRRLSDDKASRVKLNNSTNIGRTNKSTGKLNATGEIATANDAHMNKKKPESTETTKDKQTRKTRSKSNVESSRSKEGNREGGSREEPVKDSSTVKPKVTQEAKTQGTKSNVSIDKSNSIKPEDTSKQPQEENELVGEKEASELVSNNKATKNNISKPATKGKANMNNSKDLNEEKLKSTQENKDIQSQSFSTSSITSIESTERKEDNNKVDNSVQSTSYAITGKHEQTEDAKTKEINSNKITEKADIKISEEMNKKTRQKELLQSSRLQAITGKHEQTEDGKTKETNSNKITEKADIKISEEMNKKTQQKEALQSSRLRNKNTEDSLVATDKRNAAVGTKKGKVEKSLNLGEGANKSKPLNVESLFASLTKGSNTSKSNTSSTGQSKGSISKSQSQFQTKVQAQSNIQKTESNVQVECINKKPGDTESKLQSSESSPTTPRRRTRLSSQSTDKSVELYVLSSKVIKTSPKIQSNKDPKTSTKDTDDQAANANNKESGGCDKKVSSAALETVPNCTGDPRPSRNSNKKSEISKVSDKETKMVPRSPGKSNKTKTTDVLHTASCLVSQSESTDKESDFGSSKTEKGRDTSGNELQNMVQNVPDSDLKTAISSVKENVNEARDRSNDRRRSSRNVSNRNVSETFVPSDASDTEKVAETNTRSERHADTGHNNKTRRVTASQAKSEKSQDDIRKASVVKNSPTCNAKVSTEGQASPSLKRRSGRLNKVDMEEEASPTAAENITENEEIVLPKEEPDQEVAVPCEEGTTVIEQRLEGKINEQESENVPGSSSENSTPNLRMKGRQSADAINQENNGPVKNLGDHKIVTNEGTSSMPARKTRQQNNRALDSTVETTVDDIKTGPENGPNSPSENNTNNLRASRRKTRQSFDGGNLENVNDTAKKKDVPKQGTFSVPSSKFPSQKPKEQNKQNLGSTVFNAVEQDNPSNSKSSSTGQRRRSLRNTADNDEALCGNNESKPSDRNIQHEVTKEEKESEVKREIPMEITNSNLNVDSMKDSSLANSKISDDKPIIKSSKGRKTRRESVESITDPISTPATKRRRTRQDSQSTPLLTSTPLDSPVRKRGGKSRADITLPPTSLTSQLFEAIPKTGEDEQFGDAAGNNDGESNTDALIKTEVKQDDVTEAPAETTATDSITQDGSLDSVSVSKKKRETRHSAATVKAAEESITNTPLSTKEPKKRGRRKKSTEQTQNEESQTAKQHSVVSRTPRKRGVTKTSEEQDRHREAGEELTVEDASLTEGVPTKRGRRKSSVENKQNQSCLTTDESTMDTSLADSVPRKRTRRKNSTEQNQNEPELKPDESNAETSVKKKRGRAAKESAVLDESESRVTRTETEQEQPMSKIPDKSHVEETVTKPAAKKRGRAAKQTAVMDESESSVTRTETEQEQPMNTLATEDDSTVDTPSEKSTKKRGRVSKKLKAKLNEDQASTSEAPLSTPPDNEQGTDDSTTLDTPVVKPTPLKKVGRKPRKAPDEHSMSTTTPRATPDKEQPKEEEEIPIEIGLTGRVRRRAAVKAKNKWQEGERMLETMRKAEAASSVVFTKYWPPDWRRKQPKSFYAHAKAALAAGNFASCPFEGCGKEFWSYNQLREHVATCPNAVDNNEFSCAKCKFTSESEDVIKQHIKKHTWTLGNKRLPSDDECEAADISDDDPDVKLVESEQSSESDLEEESSPAESSAEEEDFSDGSYSKRPLKNVGANKSLLLAAAESKHEYLASLIYTECELGDITVKTERPTKKMDPLFNEGFTWTLNWQEAMEQKGGIFTKWTPEASSWILLTKEDAAPFLPDFSASVQVSFSSRKKKEKVETVTLNMLNANNSHRTWQAFVSGGPILAQAWCPIPPSSSLNTSQLLAVHSHRYENQLFPLEKSMSGHALIQFWEFDGPTDEFDGRLAFCVALASAGAVTELSWCPGRVFSDDRCGLLAAACTSGCIHLFSIPTSAWLVKNGLVSDSIDLPVYKVTPCLTLSRSFGASVAFTCLSLDWSWKEDCSLIISGFGDGAVCVWDLSSTSPLLLGERPVSEDQASRSCATQLLRPIRVLRAHALATRSVRFCQQNPRFFVSISADRQQLLWDMEQRGGGAAGVVDNMSDRSLHGLCATWPLFYPIIIYGFDDSFGNNTNSVIASDFGYGERNTMRILHVESCCFGMSFSPWLSSLAAVSSAGEVLVSYTPCMLRVNSNKKNVPEQRLNISSWETRMAAKSEICDNKNSSKYSVNMKKERSLPQTSQVDATCDENTTDSVQNLTSSSNAADVESKVNVLSEQMTENESESASIHPGTEQCNSDQMADHSPEPPKYNVVFADSKVKTVEDLGVCKKCRDLKQDHYLTSEFNSSLHSVAWNPNLGYETWLSVGGAQGLLRIYNVTGLKTDVQRKTARVFMKNTS